MMHDVSSGLDRAARDATTLDMQASIRRSVNSTCMDDVLNCAETKNNRTERNRTE